MEISECTLRLLVAIILGYVVGFERKLRYNDAGPRTHAMVSMGSCVFMLLSIYAFPHGKYDTARVAASIVSGISFLGAGNIVYNRGSLHGLTTGAGIWVTAGIGMCVGSGNIHFAAIVTMVLVAFQILSHFNIPLLSRRNRYFLKVTFKSNINLDEIIEYDEVIGCKYKKDGKKIVCTMTVLINSYDVTIDEIVKKLKANSEITAIDFLERK